MMANTWEQLPQPMGTQNGDQVRKEYTRYGFYFLLVLLLGLFVYPTLYKYDKLDQKYPVKINRITGETKVLTGLKWKKTENDPSISAVEKIKDEINQSIQVDHEKIKQEVISETTDQIIQNLKDEVASLKQEITDAKAAVEVYKKFQTDPDNYFTVGDPKDKVRKIMGVPDGINEYFNTWTYSGSTITFSKDKVKEWTNFGNNLKVR